MRRRQIKEKKLVIMVGLVGFLAGCNMLQGSEENTFYKLKYLDRQIERVYLGEVDDQALDKGIYTGYVAGLQNAVSDYLDESAYKAQQAFEEGKLIGTGLVYTWGLDGNHLVIVKVMKDSPAEMAGLEVGDKIIQVDDIKVIYSNESDLAKVLNKAEEGATNTYVVRKKTNTDEIVEKTVTIEKKVIEEASLDSKVIDNIGYVRLNNIKPGTTEELVETINGFKTNGIQKLILDIRDLYTNNLAETLKICDLFMDEGVAFKVKNKQGELTDYTTTNGTQDMEMVVITDRDTMGAIEALPMALKGQVPIVGSNTSGNGYLSELFDLGDGTGLRLATGVLYTRNGEVLSDKGVTVDEEVFMSVESMIELVEEGSMSLTSDNQLQAALKKF